jgi:transposase
MRQIALDEVLLTVLVGLCRMGCAWRMPPKDFPPMTIVYGCFLRFRREGLFETIIHHLVTRDRERVGREASPSARRRSTSQSVKTALIALAVGMDRLR